MYYLRFSWPSINLLLTAGAVVVSFASGSAAGTLVSVLSAMLTLLLCDKVEVFRMKLETWMVKFAIE